MPKPDPGARMLSFREFQSVVSHGLIGLTTKELHKMSTKRRTDEWLEELCVEVLDHGKDLE